MTPRNGMLIVSLMVVFQVTISASYEFYDSSTTICCNGTLFPKSKFDSCCGPTPYNSESALICCGDTIITLPNGTDINEYRQTHTCCFPTENGGSSQARLKPVLYDLQTQVCCEGRVHEQSNGSRWQRCCNGTLYDPDQKQCCGHRLFDFSGGKDCCGDEVYDATKKVCCMDEVDPNAQSHPTSATVANGKTGQVLRDIVGNHTQCCHGQTFDPHTQVCCSGQLVSRPATLPEHQQGTCCGTKVIEYPKLQKCCAGKGPGINGTMEYVIIDVNNVTQEFECCGKTIFDPQTEFCCGGNVLERMSERECCWTINEPYDPNEQMCCGSEIVTLQAQDKTVKQSCCYIDSDNQFQEHV